MTFPLAFFARGWKQVLQASNSARIQIHTSRGIRNESLRQGREKKVFYLKMGAVFFFYGMQGPRIAKKIKIQIKKRNSLASCHITAARFVEPSGRNGYEVER